MSSRSPDLEKRIVVLGAGRPLADAVVQRLAAESRDVSPVFLEGDKVTGNATRTAGLSVVDPAKTESIAQACRGAGTIFSCIEPDFSSQRAWTEYSSNIVYAAIEVGALLTFASHLRNSESDNTTLESDIVNAHQSELTKTVVARMPQLFGRGVINPLWKLIYNAVLSGKRAHWVGDPNVQRSLLDVEDAAGAMIELAGSPGAHGRAWNIANPETVSGRRFAELTFAAKGLEPKVGSWGRGILLTGGPLSSDSRDVLKMPYDYYSPFVLSGEEFSRAFPSFRFTPPQESISKGLVWFEGHRQGSPRHRSAR